MQIAPNCVVSIEYTLRDEDGEVIDSSEGAAPLTYIHGQGQLVPGVEKALLGKSVGDALRFVVAPEEGYGEFDLDAIQVVNRSAFPPDVELVEGMEFFVEDQAGTPSPVSIMAINGDEISLDFNHPLAGEELDFDVKIKEVRAATAEELAHGHAHGEGGHHHHE
jgi:FKBP-type peptidyl-prolyl cis-trans isomerase SlyD